MSAVSTLGDEDLSPKSLQYLDTPLESKVNLNPQDMDASGYTTLGALITGILRQTSSDRGDPNGFNKAEKSGRRSIVGLVRSAIRAIDPKFHEKESTPNWVKDIMKRSIGFGQSEDDIRERLTQILMIHGQSNMSVGERR